MTTQKPKPLDLEFDLNKIMKKFKHLIKIENQICFKDGFNYAIILIKQRIKQACEFYLRYKDNPDLLAKEHPEFRKIMLERFRDTPYIKDIDVITKVWVKPD